MCGRKLGKDITIWYDEIEGIREVPKVIHWEARVFSMTGLLEEDVSISVKCLHQEEPGILTLTMKNIAILSTIHSDLQYATKGVAP